jgi:hypothetical protein
MSIGQLVNKAVKGRVAKATAREVVENTAKKAPRLGADVLVRQAPVATGTKSARALASAPSVLPKTPVVKGHVIQTDAKLGDLRKSHIHGATVANPRGRKIELSDFSARPGQAPKQEGRFTERIKRDRMPDPDYRTPDPEYSGWRNWQGPVEW